MSSTRSRRRGHAQFHHVQPVEQVFAESTRSDFRFQIAIRGRHHLHVELHRMRRSHRSHFALLQHPQQLRLQIDGHFAHFIEKHDSAVRRAEDAERTAQGSGESPFLVPE